MTLHTWATRWGIPPAAVADLQNEFGLNGTTPTVGASAPGYSSEAFVQAAVRLEASRKGVLIWRNNVGALEDKDGRFIRYGLANDSKAVNERIKSADLIGVRPVTITAAMVGHVVGQFVSREIKPPGWHYTATLREAAQMRWTELVASVGGDAKFATGEGTL